MKIEKVDVVGFKEITSKKGNALKIIYFMSDTDDSVQGIKCGQLFVDSAKKINPKEKINIAWTGKGYEIVE